jgi:hypothetical protein
LAPSWCKFTLKISGLGTGPGKNAVIMMPGSPPYIDGCRTPQNTVSPATALFD